MPVVYFSIDFESRGNDFLKNGVNAVGIAVFNESGALLETYSSGILPFLGQEISADTQPFWDRNQHVLGWIALNSKHARDVVDDILGLYDKYKPATIEWLAYPAAYDWNLLQCLINHVKPSALDHIGFKAICISSQLSMLATMRNMSKDELRKTLCPPPDSQKAHFPHHDAENQGRLFFAIKDFVLVFEQKAFY